MLEGMKRKNLIGADPELFVRNSGHKFVSAHDLIPGTKAKPFRVNGGAIQVDGVAAEFNIDPADREDDFVENMTSVLEELDNHIKKDHPSYHLQVSPVASFPKKYFNALPEEAKELGCEADLNAWSGKRNPTPSTKKPIRTGGGHIHIGWTDDEDITDAAHVNDCVQVVKQLDSILYPLSMLWDENSERRSLYGIMGSYRVKEYGVEYRPLSNAWVADPDLYRWLFRTIQEAMEHLDNDLRIYHDKDTKNILEWCRGNSHKNLKRNTILAHYKFLVNELELPLLPSYYINPSQ